MLTFTTTRDPSAHLSGWADVFGDEETFNGLCRFVWANGYRDARGSHVYTSADEREEDIASAVDPLSDVPDLKAQAVFRQTPTVDELVIRYIAEVLGEEPSDYGL
jgi:hypothetical protein